VRKAVRAHQHRHAKLRPCAGNKIKRTSENKVHTLPIKHDAACLGIAQMWDSAPRELGVIDLYDALLRPLHKRAERHPRVAETDAATLLARRKDVLHNGVELHTCDFRRELDRFLRADACAWRGAAVVKDKAPVLALVGLNFIYTWEYGPRTSR